MRKPEIVITDNGFTIVATKSTERISLQEISAIIAYKIDEITTDLVCCNIVTGSGNGEHVRTVHEETPGFEALMARFETFPGFNLKRTPTLY